MNAFASALDLRPIDRRAGGRSRVFKSGKLMFGGVTPTVIDCLVTDMSAQGFRLETAVMVQVPALLSLRLSDGTVARARRAWAKGNEIGLEILP